MAFQDNQNVINPTVSPNDDQTQVRGATKDNFDILKVLIEAIPGGGNANFTVLLDTPDDYIGQAGKVVTVRTDETGLEFKTNTSGGGGVETLLELNDTPNAYTGQGGKVLAVKSNQTATEFVTKLSSVVAGDNVTVDNSDPQNPIINSTGGGGTGIFTEDITVNGVTVGAGDPTTSPFNTIIGKGAFASNVYGIHNFAGGNEALIANTIGNSNATVGSWSFRSNTIGSGGSGLGFGASYNSTTGEYRTALGYQSLHSDNYSYCTGLGANSAVTGNNQVQLGGSLETTYAFGAVQERSDRRDKADIEDTDLGLDFINKIRPVSFRWDYREDYKDVTENIPMAEIIKDGSKKRNRKHYGVVAQEIKAILEEGGLDWGGFQDHSMNGGEDVMSIGYNEFISPLIKAVQELSAKNTELEERLLALENK